MMPVETDATYTAAASQTRRIETQRRHAIEVRDKALAVVEDLEIRLDIARRWEDDGDNLIRVAKMAKNRTYQRAIDALEGLVVARMFELSKVNMSDTGKRINSPLLPTLTTIFRLQATETYREGAANALQGRQVRARSIQYRCCRDDSAANPTLMGSNRRLRIPRRFRSSTGGAGRYPW